MAGMCYKRSMSRSLHLILVLLLALALGACASNGEKPYVEKPVDELYNAGMDAMNQQEYSEAAHLFDEVERQHPYSEWASRAQLMAAYANYNAYMCDDAINTLDRFI